MYMDMKNLEVLHKKKYLFKCGKVILFCDVNIYKNACVHAI